MGKLRTIVYGPFHFKVAMMLRNSHIINGNLTTAEALYGQTMDSMEQLEQVDEMLLRRILEVGSCCPKEMLYLETGAIPIRCIIMQRRIMFLHYILNEGSLINKVLDAQIRKPCKNDWVESVKRDLIELDM